MAYLATLLLSSNKIQDKASVYYYLDFDSLHLLVVPISLQTIRSQKQLLLYVLPPSLEAPGI